MDILEDDLQENVRDGTPQKTYPLRCLICTRPGFSEFATYEDYLDSQITAEDMKYLQVDQKLSTLLLFSLLYGDSGRRLGASACRTRISGQW